MDEDLANHSVQGKGIQMVPLLAWKMVQVMDPVMDLAMVIHLDWAMVLAMEAQMALDWVQQMVPGKMTLTSTSRYSTEVNVVVDSN